MTTRLTQGLTTLMTLSLLTACGGGGGGGGGAPAPDGEPQPPESDPKAPTETSVSLTASELSASPSTDVPADGFVASTIQVVLLDSAGEPVADQTIELQVSGTGYQLGAAELKSDADGRASTTLRSSTAETKTITAMIGEGDQKLALEKQADVTFVTPPPATLSRTRYEDTDASGSLSAGDQLVMTFDADVSASTPSLADFELAVAGDSFGAGASVQAGPGADELTLTLGENAKLRTRGAYDARTSKNVFQSAFSPSPHGAVPVQPCSAAATSSLAASSTWSWANRLSPAPGKTTTRRRISPKSRLWGP